MTRVFHELISPLSKLLSVGFLFTTNQVRGDSGREQTKGVYLCCVVYGMENVEMGMEVEI